MVCTSPEMPRTRFVTLEEQSWLETIVKDVPTSSSLTQKKTQDHNPIRFGSWQYINSYNLCRFQRCSMLSWVYYTVLEKFGKLVTVDLYQIVIHWNLYITTLYYATMTKQSLVFKDALLLRLIPYQVSGYPLPVHVLFLSLFKYFFFAFSWSNHNLVGYDWGSRFFLLWTARCSAVKCVEVNRHLKNQVFHGKPPTANM